MTFVINQPIFKINQEILSFTNSSPYIHGKVECFNLSPKNGKNQRNHNNRFNTFQPFDANNTLYATQQHFRCLSEALSASFPDFDFSSVSPWNFKLVSSPEQALIDINWKFQTVLPETEQLTKHIWSVLEKEIYPAACEIYLYESDRPDAFSAMGAVFNLTYFFLNEKMNKVMLVHLREGAGESDEEVSDDEIEGEYWI